MRLQYTEGVGVRIVSELGWIIGRVPVRLTHKADCQGSEQKVRPPPDLDRWRPARVSHLPSGWQKTVPHATPPAFTWRRPGEWLSGAKASLRVRLQPR